MKPRAKVLDVIHVDSFFVGEEFGRKQQIDCLIELLSYI